ncbi:MAG: hypothetical protein LCH61_01460 [Proteobacteria bacterium]|nr:hypothetical protein [Pseudomonadota bacterium]
MRSLVFVALLAAGTSLAQARPMTPSMTCEAVQRLVQRSGAIVLGFGPDLYDRVVSTQRACLYSEVLEPIWVPTRNNRQCFAGYTCKEGDYWRW